MAIFRVEKTRQYTVMSNYHLRDKSISLKAKGLLSQMLSLPEDWDYTLAGLAYINREKIDAIREAIKELERAGYIVRSRERDDKGRLRGTEYIIYEQPSFDEERQTGEQEPTTDLPTLENPILEKPTLENPILEKPTLEKPTLENPTQLNKDILSKEKSNKDDYNLSINQSLSCGSEIVENATPRQIDRFAEKEKQYAELVRANIEYNDLAEDYIPKEELDEIVGMIVRAICSRKQSERICGQDFPREVIQSVLARLDRTCIENALESMKKTDNIRNYEKYFISTLFNEVNCRHCKENREERWATYAVNRDYGWGES